MGLRCNTILKKGTMYYKSQTVERQRAVTLLYSTNWDRVRSAALDSNPNLTANDAYECVARLADRLQHYPVNLKLTDDAFCSWAANVLETSVFICALKSETESYVYAAVHRVLAACEELGVNQQTPHELGTADEIASDVWTWALDHIDELMKAGTAKLTTRMYARARWQARAWKTRQLRDRARYAPIDAAERIEDDGRPKLRAIVLGPGDEFAYDEPEYTEAPEPYDCGLAA